MASPWQTNRRLPNIAPIRGQIAKHPKAIPQKRAHKKTRSNSRRVPRTKIRNENSASGFEDELRSLELMKRGRAFRASAIDNSWAENA